jgi:hypothetical protein
MTSDEFNNSSLATGQGSITTLSVESKSLVTTGCQGGGMVNVLRATGLTVDQGDGLW